MTALDFYKNRLKDRGFSKKQIKDLTDHKDLPWLKFAEDYHKEQLALSGVTKRLNWMSEEMDKAKPFSQSYNNLNERHSRLLEAKKILDKEGLWP